MNYKVVLHDSDPSTDEGLEKLDSNLQAVLGLSAERSKEIIDAMPITLKQGINEVEARDFATVLRELGALVFIEKEEEEEELDKSSEDDSEASNLKSKERSVQPAAPKKPRKWYAKPYLLVIYGLLVGCLIMLTVTQGDDSGGLLLTQDAIMRLLSSQRKIIGPDQKKDSQEEVIKESWYGKSIVDTVTVIASVLTHDGKPVEAKVKVSTLFPGERSADEIIRKVYRPWLRSGIGKLKNVANQKNRLINEELQKTLSGQLRLYLENDGIGKRIIADTSLKMVGIKSAHEREFTLEMSYNPKEKFIEDKYFLNYSRNQGYSIILNQELVIHKREDPDLYNLDPWNKSLAEEKKQEPEAKK